MHRTSLFLIMTTAAALFAACGKDTIDLNGTTVFKADGAVIRYASFGSGEKPRFHAVRALKGVDTEEPLEIVGVFPAGPEVLVAVTRKHGLYRISGLGKSFTRIDRGLPPEVVYPFKKKNVTKPVFSFAVSSDAKRVAIIVPSDLYLSRDGGSTFERLPLAGVKRYTEYLSVAIGPDRDGPILIGTSSNGVYVSRDGGATARRIRGGVPGEPTRTPNFLEEIRSLCFGGDGDTFYAGFGNGGGVYRGSVSRGMMEKIDMAPLFTYPDGDFYRVTSVNWTGGELFIGTNRNWRKVVRDGTARGIAPDGQTRDLFLNDESVIGARVGGRNLFFPGDYRPGRSFDPDRRALGKHAMYISYSFTQGENYAKLLKLLRYLTFNAVVMNLKDDYGSIRVPVSDPLIRQVPGSVNPYKNVLQTIKRLRSDGIYVIARQVCFKDEKVFQYLGNKYAVKNPGGLPFHKGPEKWVDGYSEFVWDYNIAVAKELQKAGVDEIQFDYIRFPDVRGEVDNRRFDFKKEHQTMREALASYLIKARAALTAPISIDLFGYNAIY
nr:putative glycoside hydrolase [Spirochaetota bacterium]